MSKTATVTVEVPIVASTKSSPPTIREIRNAIPDHCFKPNNLKSAGHAVFDTSMAVLFAYVSLKTIPLVEFWPARWLLWTLYGYIQGLIFTGVWIVAHECGHGSLFSTTFLNDSFGFVLHTILMVPYFPWKYTHARHHR